MKYIGGIATGVLLSMFVTEQPQSMIVSFLGAFIFVLVYNEAKGKEK